MSGTGMERRVAAKRLALAALVPFAALPVPIGAALAARRGVSVPLGSFRLERVLSRQLSGDAAIVVTRRWRIAFAAGASGMTVSGEQISADVAAPAGLAPLAAIERARSASEIFPLMLDETGLILPSARAPGTPQLVRALETGRALVQSLPILATEREDAREFMAQLASLSAGAVSQLPRDLFFPQPGDNETRRDLMFPGGGKGSITVTASTQAADDSGLLVASERRIVTRLADSARGAGERWTLTPI